ncbi:MAG: hypothetical protein PHF86_06730 [Candidatus Nanoarchaeia archaeon]|jgi:hypothetical protein|nr:hypothetical protein [Candidatus Nanoarchaeia archaeon]
MSEKLSEKKQDFETALQNIENIIEGDKIERFKFTPKEKQTLAFVAELLSLHIQEFK